MSDASERVFDYERQTWVSVGEGETADQALARAREADPVVANAVVQPIRSKESGAARFLLIGGIVAFAIGGLFELIGLGVLHQAPGGLPVTGALFGLASGFMSIGALMVFVIIAIHAFYDIGVRRGR